MTMLKSPQGAFILQQDFFYATYIPMQFPFQIGFSGFREDYEHAQGVSHSLSMGRHLKILGV
ncbi:hypothetical protein TUMEXPCC7403_21425 [Tumidithrix helvetica PCC 7403]|uniref:hypothetical protein n=1 Tax=Tumidithrix helvetica TaxID=3457545 RepID=UPI003C7F7E47